MSALLAGCEYDIFISYRQKDNKGDRWVTDFVKALKTELDATFKEDLSIYFDENPHDGLLETHNVDKSLEGKLKCLIFIPIISQTYCDPKSFAWQHEFCAFNKLAKTDSIGRDIKLGSGNVASRILPIKIHDLDPDDNALVENEIGGVLRAIEFIYKEPGVNRPLKPNDLRNDNLNRTDYRNQVNKVANAAKELLFALTNKTTTKISGREKPAVTAKKRITSIAIASTLIVLIASLAFLYANYGRVEKADEATAILDRAEKYLEESIRFDDNRYILSAQEAIRKVLSKDPVNERALYLMVISFDKEDSIAGYINKLFIINPSSIYGLLLRAGRNADKRNFASALTDLKRIEELDPVNKDAPRLLAFVYWNSGNYMDAWKYAKRSEELTGESSGEMLSYLFLELGDFKESLRQLESKIDNEGFSCRDIENYQRILLCEGAFEKLERATDSICGFAKCEQCPYWLLRAKMHAGKYEEGSRYSQKALQVMTKIGWRLPAYVLMKVGKKDSASLISQAELKYDMERLADTAQHQSFPLYSLSALNAMQGNKTESIKWLRQYADKGFEGGSEWYIVHDPLFDEVLKDNKYFAEFMQIVQKEQARKSAIREKVRELESKPEYQSH